MRDCNARHQVAQGHARHVLSKRIAQNYPIVNIPTASANLARRDVPVLRWLRLRR